MSSDTVMITPTGRDAIDKMKRAIDSDLLNNIQTLADKGQTLSNPSVWEGQAANKFRGEWPEIERSLRRMHEQLTELQRRIHDTHTRIGGQDHY